MQHSLQISLYVALDFLYSISLFPSTFHFSFRDNASEYNEWTWDDANKQKEREKRNQLMASLTPLIPPPWGISRHVGMRTLRRGCMFASPVWARIHYEPLSLQLFLGLYHYWSFLPMTNGKYVGNDEPSSEEGVHNLVLTKPQPLGKDEWPLCRAYFKMIGLSHLVPFCFLPG